VEDVASIVVVLEGTDADGTIASFNLSSLPANGTLYTDALLTIPAVTGTNYTAIGNALTLYFVPAANWNGTTSLNFTATDNQGLVSASATETITVTAVNDTPAIAPLAGIAVTEDVATKLTGIVFTDVDAGAGNVTVTYTVPAGTLTATSGAGVTVGGTATALTFTGTLAAINTFISTGTACFTKQRLTPMAL
jgi:large repetitive protein